MKKKLVAGIAVMVLIVASLLFVYQSLARQTDEATTGTIQIDGEAKVIHQLNTKMIIGSRLYQIYALDRATNEQVWTAKTEGEIVAVKHSTDQVFAVSTDRKLYQLDAASGEVLGTVKLMGPPIAMDVRNDGSLIAIATSLSEVKNRLYLYDREGQERLRLETPVKINAIQFDAAGESLYTALDNGYLEKRSLDGEVLSSIRLQRAAVAMAYDPDSAISAYITKEGGVYIVNAELEIISQFTLPKLADSHLLSIAVEEGHSQYAAGSSHGELFIFQAQGEIIYRSQDSSLRPIWDMAFTAGNEKLLVSRSNGGVDVLEYAAISKLEGIKRLQSVLLLLSSLGILGLILMAVHLSDRTKGQFYRLAKEIWRKRIAYIILIPAFALIALFCYFPIYQALVRSFTDWNATSTKIHWIGFDNFRLMVTEGYFFAGVQNMLILLVTTFIKVITVPLILAELVFNLTSNKARYQYRLAFVMPMIVPGIVLTLVWKSGVYDPDFGALNSFLGMIGLEGWQRNWLADESWAIWAIVFAGFPFASAFHFLIYYGGLIGISRELFDAAKVDGCSRWRAMFLIDFPLISPQIKLMLILAFIGTIQDFGASYFLTEGGPGISTYVPGLELFFNATKFGRYGYASALGMVMFIFILGMTILNMRVKTAAEK